jgi:hypothetical protein
VFKQIYGYENLYSVNELGEVLSHSKNGRAEVLLKPIKTVYGYYVEYLEAEIERLEAKNQRLKECQTTPAT